MSENINLKKLVTIINENSEKDEAGSVEAKPTTSKKNEYLEVNKCEKYKSFLLNKPDIKAESVKPSEALNRLRQFLPLFKESTDKLLDECKTKPDEFNIENVADEEEHIEMNVAFVPDGQDDDDDDDESDEEEEEEETETESESEEEAEEDDASPHKRKLDQNDEPLDLGFKYKSNQITKLKLNKSNDKKSKNLIQLVDNKEEEEVEKNKDDQ